MDPYTLGSNSGNTNFPHNFVIFFSSFSFPSSYIPRGSLPCPSSCVDASYIPRVCLHFYARAWMCCCPLMDVIFNRHDGHDVSCNGKSVRCGMCLKILGKCVGPNMCFKMCICVPMISRSARDVLIKFRRLIYVLDD
ncbi:unnamed protein product [Rhodiola kirilowii]